MNKLLVLLIAGAFASVAAAQTAAPKLTTKEKQQATQSTTSAAVPQGQDTAKQQAESVKASKDVSKMTTAEKNKAIKNVNKQMVNPDNPTGSVAGTASMQKSNVDASKGTPKDRPKLGTAEAQKALQKASTP